MGLLKLTPTYNILLIYIGIHWVYSFAPSYTQNTPPQVGEYISYNPSLLHNKPKRVLHKVLVNILAIWTLVETYGIAIIPSSTFSRVIWQSTSIYLVYSWNTGLEAMWIATWLSQCIVIGNFITNFNSSSKCLIDIRSHDVCAMTLYLASALDLATTVCFFLFQVIKFPPGKAQCSVVDFLSDGDPAQTASERFYL